jgi:hypothetical protein
MIFVAAKRKSLKNLRIASDKSVHGLSARRKSAQLVSPGLKRRTQFSTEFSLFTVEARAFCNF